MSGPSTLGSLGLHISVSNWICKASGIVWNKQILRFCFTQVHSQCCGNRTCITPLFRLTGYMWWTRNGHGLGKVTTFFPGKVLSSSWPYSQLSIDTSVYRPLLPPQKQGLSKCSDQICCYHKWIYFLLCGQAPRRLQDMTGVVCYKPCIYNKCNWCHAYCPGNSLQ